MIPKLPWRFMVWMALPGAIIGALVVLGLFGPGKERFVWLPYTAICAIVIARRQDESVVLVGAVTGFLSGAFSTFLQGIFVDTMLANNAWMAERFAAQPEGFSVRYFVLMLVPFIGLASAAVLAISTWLVGRALRRSGGDGA